MYFQSLLQWRAEEISHQFSKPGKKGDSAAHYTVVWESAGQQIAKLTQSNKRTTKLDSSQIGALKKRQQSCYKTGLKVTHMVAVDFPQSLWRCFTWRFSSKIAGSLGNQREAPGRQTRVVSENKGGRGKRRLGVPQGCSLSPIFVQDATSRRQ